jgi:hypothetical protein
MTTKVANFSEACASALETTILIPIINHLANKGVNVYLEELRGVIGLPGTMANNETKIELSIPKTSSPFGGALPTISKSKTKASDVLPIVGRNCVYQFKRGENKDHYCNKATAGGAEYCNTCLKNRKNLVKSTTTSAPGVAVAPLVIPQELTVVPYDLGNNLYREPNYNFIVYSSTPGVVIVIGVLDDETNEIVPITEHQKSAAKNLGLLIKEEMNNQPETSVIKIS